MSLTNGLRRALSTPSRFSETFLPDFRMRRYQAEVADGIAVALTNGADRAEVERSFAGAQVNTGRGQENTFSREFAAVFSRQAGKDEMLAQLCAWLLVRSKRSGGQVIVVLPALDPQGLIARDRLIARLEMPRLRAIGVVPRVREGRTIQLGRASVQYVSASPMANARGLTASLLLVANEAQDIEPDRWDAVFSPMAASTNAPTLFMGTVWTSDTLLSRQLNYFRELEGRDGRQRRYLVPWREVAEELPDYGAYVERQIAQLGEDHPFIRSEYELIELDGDGGLFPALRQAQMQGEHAPMNRAQPGEIYSMLLDVAGEEEESTNPGSTYQPDAKRDSTALTVVRVVTNESRPRYEVVQRYLWTGVSHTQLHHQIVDLARTVWKATYLVVDATGIGAGLSSFLRDALGERVVIPFVFSATSKSKLGWDFLGIIDSGRFKDYSNALTPVPSPNSGRGEERRESNELANIFWKQVRACRYQVRPGPNRLLSWEVPDARTHDDLLISAALVAVLDEQSWRPRTARGVVNPR